MIFSIATRCSVTAAMRNVEKESVVETVREFLREHPQDGDKRTTRSAAISVSTDLLAEGHVTSLTFMTLLLFLEERLGIQVSLGKLAQKRLVTVGDLFAAIEPPCSRADGVDHEESRRGGITSHSALSEVKSRNE